MLDLVVYGWKTLYKHYKDLNLANVGYIPFEEENGKGIEFDKNQTLVIGASPHQAKKYGLVKEIQCFKMALLNYFQMLQPSHVIFISSASVYGFSIEKELPFKETSPLRGKTTYATEKIELEVFIDDMSKKYKFSYTIIRAAGFFNIPYPKKRRNLIDTLVDKLKIGDGETILVENKGQHKRDFCDFQLLSSLIVQINRKPSSFKGAFNFSTTTPITLAMLIEALNAKKVVAFRPFENKPLNNFLSTTKIEKVLSQFSDHTLLAKLDFLK